MYKLIKIFTLTFFSFLIQTTLNRFIPHANPVFLFRIGLEIETCIDVNQMTV